MKTVEKIENSAIRCYNREVKEKQHGGKKLCQMRNYLY
jgi:hypothetical protein